MQMLSEPEVPEENLYQQSALTSRRRDRKTVQISVTINSELLAVAARR